ncbi:aldo/keto reductase [Plantibacter sp. 2H11-2]|uniref:aldo/keto reductase n=1 Tax=Plantibacter sp. 2H11-2 TaxID=3414431 RepID=UPI003CF745D7
MATLGRHAREPHALDRNRLGASGLEVTVVGIGGSPLGGAEALYGHDTTSESAVRTVQRVFAGPINFLDTSNNYGDGRSEQRIGAAIGVEGGLPQGFVLATKVDADQGTGRFDRDRVLRSFDESTARLGLDLLHLVHLHDPEMHVSADEALGKDGAVAGLIELRNAGRVGAIGIAGGVVSEMTTYVASGLFDVLLTHNRFTLVDRTADALIDDATALGMGVLNAAPFGGGVLARTPRSGDRYAYGSGTAEQVAAAIAMHELLEPHGIPLAAAALQFSMRDSRVHSTLVGASTPERIDENLALLDIAIPDEIWESLERLLPARESWLND